MKVVSQNCRSGSPERRIRAFHRGLPLALLASCAIAAAPAHAEVALNDLDFELAQLDLAPAVADAAQPEPLSFQLTAAAIQSELPPADDQSVRIGASDEELRMSFGGHFKAIKTEMAVAFGYMTAVNILKIINRGEVSGFKTRNEGFFGKDTPELGIDKLAHAHNTYVLAELIAARIRKNTGTTKGTAMSGALLATGLMFYSEVYDGFKGGFGVHDLVFNGLGAGFSVLRNTAGLEDELDFRVLVIPNHQIYSPTGHEHYRQLRYMFALELAGFKQLERSPLRFVELHAGYYGKGFTDKEVDRGDPRQRKLFAGIGLNLNELLFKRSPRTKAARTVSQALDYWQPPYTYVHAD